MTGRADRFSRMGKIDRHVAEQIRTLRAACGLTQEKLGKNVGVTFQQIQKYEHAKNHVTAVRLYQIACALRVPVQDFFPQQQVGEYAPVPTRMLRVMRILSAIPAKYHDEIVAICMALENIITDTAGRPEA